MRPGVRPPPSARPPCRSQANPDAGGERGQRPPAHAARPPGGRNAQAGRPIRPIFCGSPSPRGARSVAGHDLKRDVLGSSLRVNSRSAGIMQSGRLWDFGTAHRRSLESRAVARRNAPKTLLPIRAPRSPPSPEHAVRMFRCWGNMPDLMGCGHL